MTTGGETDWAAAHYRVERISSGVRASRRKLRRMAEAAARFGDPPPEQSHDVIRIYDREGRVVMERDWGQSREAAAAEEARIVEDLLHLNVIAFRAKYGIPAEPPKPGSSAPGAEPAAPDPGAQQAEGKPQGTSG